MKFRSTNIPSKERRDFTSFHLRPITHLYSLRIWKWVPRMQFEISLSISKRKHNNIQTATTRVIQIRGLNVVLNLQYIETMWMEFFVQDNANCILNKITSYSMIFSATYSLCFDVLCVQMKTKHLKSATAVDWHSLYKNAFKIQPTKWSCNAFHGICKWHQQGNTELKPLTYSHRQLLIYK